MENSPHPDQSSQPTQPDFDRILIVEDDNELRAALARSARERCGEVLEAGNLSQALDCLGESPQLVIVDVRLPDGSGIELVERCAERTPLPVVVAISGEASPEEAFRLARAGAAGYLAKPITLDALWEKVAEVALHPPDIGPVIAASVGHHSMKEVQKEVRGVMVDQALGLAKGNRRGAARLLDVSRQAVQHIIRGRESDDKDPE